MRKIILGISTSLALFKVKFLGKRVPLAIGWAITKRCNYRCKYCASWQTNTEELNTKEICDIIDEMASVGVKRILFTGGEPLIREDIGKIIDYSYRKYIFVYINSNGSLVKDKISDLKNISYLGLSLEGPPEVHDALRQKGSFQCVLEAAQTAAFHKIQVIFNTTINSCNYGYIDYLLNLAAQHNAQIVFQPSTAKMLFGTKDNPVALNSENYAEAATKIIDRKKGRYSKTIRNSVTGLVHLSRWPSLPMIRCAGGLISCRIEPDGSVFHCAIIKDILDTPPNCKNKGFKNAFYNLPSILCNKCCCALRVEAGYVLRLNISALTAAYTCEKYR